MTNTSNPQIDDKHLRAIIIDEFNTMACDKHMGGPDAEFFADSILSIIAAHAQAAVDAAHKELVNQIVSNSHMGTDSLRGGKDTFTIDKQTLWRLVRLKSKKGNSDE